MFVADAEEFERLADEYFDECEAQDRPALITGLALHMGFASRQSFYDYEQRPEFSYVVKRARLRVEMGYELQLWGPRPTGAIFSLKNMGWSDRQTLEHSGPEGGPIEFGEMTDAEVQERAAQLANRLAAYQQPSTNGRHN
jgi:hypothetical protein